MSYFEGPPLSWHHLLEVLPDGIAYVDEHGVICHANERLEVLTGYARDELVGQAVEMLVPSRYRGSHAAQSGKFAGVLDAGALGTGSGLTLLRRDGLEIAIEAAIAPLILDGKPWTVVAIRDDSAQIAAAKVRAEVELHAVASELASAEALANSEQRFRLAFENNMAGMIFVDLEDRILAVNDAFCQMAGRDRQEIIGKDSAPFTHPEDRGITEEAHRRLTSGEADQVSYTKRYLKNDGRVIDVEVSKSPAGRYWENVLLRHVGPGHHPGTGAQCATLPSGTARPANGPRQPGALRGPALPGAREGRSPGRVGSRVVVGPR